jgi:probable HAF family extracellular repeat protein
MNNHNCTTHAQRLAGLASLALATAALAQPSYTLVDLGQLGFESHAFAIGPDRAAVGSFTNSASDFQAYLAATIPSPIPTAPSFAQAVAFAINPDGFVIGTSYNLGDLDWHAFLLDGTSVMDLGQFAARAVNSAGVVAGTSNLTVNSGAGTLVLPRACRWTNGSLEVLPTLGGSSAQGLTIDNAGRVAGSSWNANDVASRPCLWTGAVASDLGTLGGTSGQVFCLRGDVAVGMSKTSAGVAHATRWNLGPTGNVLSRTDLGALQAGFTSVAHAVNSTGDAVGNSDFIAVIWHAGQTVDLNTLVDAPNWHLANAWDIDDAGRIVGTGSLLGVPRAFMLLPVGPCPPCAADYDQNGGVDGGDLGAFFADFEQGLSCADVDQNGGIDGGDLAFFFAVFEAGGC